MDQKTQTNYWQQFFIAKGLELLSEDSKILQSLMSLAKGILAGRAQEKENTYSKIGKYVLEGADLAHTLYKIATMMSTFESEFVAMLKKEGVDQKLSEQLATIQAQQTTETKSVTQKTNDSKQRVNNLTNFQPPPVNLDDEDIVVRKVSAGYESKQTESESMLAPEFYKPSKMEYLQSAFTGRITIQLMNKVNQKLIKPVTSKLVNYGVDAMTKGYQDTLNEQIKTFQSDNQVKIMSDQVANGNLKR